MSSVNACGWSAFTAGPVRPTINEGSLQYANRWTFKGTPMLYGSTVLSLCCLEILVHTVDARIIPPGLVWSYAHLEDVTVLDFRWDVHNQDLTREAGHNWIHNGGEPATRVPSVIIPVEYNVLLTPYIGDSARFIGVSPDSFLGTED